MRALITMVLLFCAQLIGLTSATSSLTLRGSGAAQIEVMSDLILTYQTDYSELRSAALQNSGLETQLIFEQTETVDGLCLLRNETSWCHKLHTLLQKTKTGGGSNAQLVIQPEFRDYVVIDGFSIQALQNSGIPDIRAVPIAAVALVLVANIPGLPEPPLILSMDVLANIFKQCNNSIMCIDTWGHPSILAINLPVNRPVLQAMGKINRIVPYQDGMEITRTFQRGLIATDPDLAIQFGGPASADATWAGVLDITRVESGTIFTATVLNSPGSLSYLQIDEAHAADFTFVALNVNGAIVQATSVTTQVASFATGLPDPTLSNSIDISPSPDINRWPFVQYSYLAFRANHVHPGSTCTTKALMLDFFMFILTSDVASSILALHLVSRPADKVVQASINIMQTELMCDGVPVYVNPTPAIDIHVQGLITMYSLFQAYELVHDQKFQFSNVMYMGATTHSAISLEFATQNSLYGKIVLADETMATDLTTDDKFSSANFVYLPFAVLGSGFVYQWCDPQSTADCAYDGLPLTLSLDVAGRILDGDITNWNHTDIIALNPGITLPPIDIVVVGGPPDSKDQFDFVARIRNCCRPTFSYKGNPGTGGTLEFPSFAAVRGKVFGTAGAIAFVPFNVSNAAFGVLAAKLVNTVNAVVSPDPKNLEACAIDTYDSTTNLFTLRKSQNKDCYPLATSIYIIGMSRYENTSIACPQGVATDNQYNGVATETVYLMDFAFSGAQVEQALRLEGFGSLQSVQTSDISTGQNLSMAIVNRDNLESITCGGLSVIAVNHNLNLIPDALIYTFYFFVCVCLLMNVSLAIWVIYHRNRKIIRNSSPSFMLQVLFGASIQLCTVFALAQQDDWMAPRGVVVSALNPPSAFLDNACVAEPVLFSMGFFTMYSALFLKAWRLVRIFNNTKLRHLYIKDVQLFMYQVFVMVIVVVLNLIWVIQTPLIWERMAIQINAQNGLVIESAGLCFSAVGIAPALPLLVGVLLVLVVGNYLAWLGRSIPTEFNESKWTAMAMVVFLQCMVLGIPVLALSNDQPVAGFVVKSIICIVTAGATVCLIFGPKVALANGWFQANTSDVWKQADGSSSDKKNVQKGSKNVVVSNPDVTGGTGANAVTTAGGVGKTNPHFSSPGSPTTSKSSGVERKAPSLASLVDTSSFNINPNRNNVARPPNPGGSKGDALTQILHEDPLKRRFRRFLVAQNADENLKFWDACDSFQKEPETKRASSARAIIKYFVMDTAPKQVNLTARTRARLLEVFKANDGKALCDVTLFDEATAEVFADLKQSDAFQQFLSAGGATSLDLTAGGNGGGSGGGNGHSTDLSLS